MERDYTVIYFSNTGSTKIKKISAKKINFLKAGVIALGAWSIVSGGLIYYFCSYEMPGLESKVKNLRSALFTYQDTDHNISELAYQNKHVLDEKIFLATSYAKSNTKKTSKSFKDISKKIGLEEASTEAVGEPIIVLDIPEEPSINVFSLYNESKYQEKNSYEFGAFTFNYSDRKSLVYSDLNLLRTYPGQKGHPDAFDISDISSHFLLSQNNLMPINHFNLSSQKQDLNVENIKIKSGKNNLNIRFTVENTRENDLNAKVWAIAEYQVNGKTYYITKPNSLKLDKNSGKVLNHSGIKAQQTFNAESYSDFDLTLPGPRGRLAQFTNLKIGIIDDKGKSLVNYPVEVAINYPK